MLSSCPDSLQPHGLWPTRLLCPWDSPGRNTGMGCHCLLQGSFRTQGLNSCLLHWQTDSLPLSHLGNPEYRRAMSLFHAQTLPSMSGMSEIAAYPLTARYGSNLNVHWHEWIKKRRRCLYKSPCSVALTPQAALGSYLACCSVFCLPVELLLLLLAVLGFCLNREENLDRRASGTKEHPS